MVLTLAPPPLNRPHRTGFCRKMLIFFVFEVSPDGSKGCNVSLLSGVTLPTGNPTVLMELVSPLLPLSASQKLCVNLALNNQPVMEHLKWLLEAPATPNLGSNLTIRPQAFSMPFQQSACLFAALGRNPKEPLVLKGRHHLVKVHLAPSCLPSRNRLFSP